MTRYLLVQLAAMEKAPGGAIVGKMVSLPNKYLLRVEPRIVLGCGHMTLMELLMKEQEKYCNTVKIFVIQCGKGFQQ